MGLHNYLATNDTFPMGSTLQLYDNRNTPGSGSVIPGEDAWSWSNWSVLAVLLPYMEQNPIYSSINFNVAPFGVGNGISNTASLTKISTFLCPSDGYAGADNIYGAFINSYYGSMGPSTGSASQNSGLFAETVGQRIASVTDGTSNSIAFSERLVGRPGQPDHTPGNGMNNVNALRVTGLGPSRTPCRTYPMCCSF